MWSYVHLPCLSYNVKAYSIPEGRVKPWGTGHAILSCLGTVKEPFAVINADDYYGRNSFEIIHKGLTNGESICMAGFRLGNTLTENGTVSRGVCEVEDGYLKTVVEHTSLTSSSGVSLDSIVSMNMWGLTPDIFNVLDSEFKAFLATDGDPLKKEFFIPSVIDGLINNQGAKVKVLNTDEKWYGMTYREDLESVRQAIADLTEKGLYEKDF